MSGYDGSIKIGTKIDQRGFNKGRSDIERGLKGMTSSFKGLAAAAGIAFGTAAIIHFGRESVKAASDMSNALQGLESVVAGQGRSFGEAQKFIREYTEDGLIPATDAITAYKNLALRGYDDSQIKQVMIALKDASAFGRQSSYTMGEAVRSATEGLKNENSILVDNAGVTKNVAKMWDEYARSLGTNAQALTQQQKIQAEVIGIMEESKFQVGDAAKVADTYSGQVMRLGFAFNDLKIAVGNAIIPIAKAIIPGIAAIIRALTRLANTFAAVTALIFGKKSKGVKNMKSTADTQKELSRSGAGAAKSQNKLGKATKGAGKAAKQANKELKETLAGFDELNVLASESHSPSPESGGSGGGGGGDVGGDGGGGLEGGEIWKDAKVDPEIPKSIEALQRLLQRLADYCVREFGPSFAKAKALIVPQIVAIGETFKKMGRDLLSLGEPLKKWFTGDFTTLIKHSIDSIGIILSGLLESFNMVMRDVWDIAVFPLLEKFVTIVLPTLTRLSTFWIDTFTVLFSTVKNIFDTLWTEGVKPVMELIMGIVLDVIDIVAKNYNHYMKPIFEGIQEAIKKTGDLILTIWKEFVKPIVDKVIEKVKDLWDNHLKKLLDNLIGFVNECILLGITIYNKFIVPVVKAFVEKFGPPIAHAINAVITVISSIVAIVADVVNGVITSLKGIVQFLTGVFSGNWQKAWDGIKNIFKGVWDAFAGIVKGVVNIVIDLINGMLRAVTNGFNRLLGVLNKLNFEVPDWVPGIGGEKIGFSFNKVSPPQIPRLAKGAVIPPNAEFAAILGDQKNGKNLEAPEGLIRQIIKDELANLPEPKVTVVANGDISGIVRLMDFEIQRERKRRGPSLIPEGV